MPLRCHDVEADRDVHSIDVPAASWTQLAVDNRVRHHLVTTCCGRRVSLRRSRLKLQYFAHLRTGECVAKPETDEHRAIKTVALLAARAAGWDAQTEVDESGADGTRWRADVLAQKGSHSVAIEVQWSSQTDEETYRRQQRYVDAGLRGLWLFRQRSFPHSKAIPSVKLCGNVSDGFLVSIGSGAAVSMPLEDFLTAVFEKRFRHGLKPLRTATAMAWRGKMPCYRCDRKTNIVTRVEFQLGPHQCSLTVPELGRILGLEELLRPKLKASFATIRRRYSAMQGEAYLSNACHLCGAFIGEFHEHEAWIDQRQLQAAEIDIDAKNPSMMTEAFVSAEGAEPGWGVWSREPEARP